MISIEISNSQDVAVVSFSNLELNFANPLSSQISLTVQKEPIRLEAGKSWNNGAVLIDEETPEMRALSVQAQSLLSLPEPERVSKVLKILLTRVRYAYNSQIKKLEKTDLSLAKWVADNIGVGSDVGNVPISDLIRKGFGVCRHLSTSYLWLAQNAGLQGVLLNCGNSVLRNIIRPDTHEKLFQSVEIGRVRAAHSWVEIKTLDFGWVPVDPSAQLVGDTQEKLGIFKQANYVASGGMSLLADVEPAELIPACSSLEFLPSDPVSEVRYQLELRSSRPVIGIGLPDAPPTNIPYTGPAKLKFQTTTMFGDLGLKILNVKGAI